MNGRHEQLKLLLNQQDPAALGRMLAYYGYFGRARAERITAITEHLAHLELLSESIAAETARLRDLEAENARDAKAESLLLEVREDFPRLGGLEGVGLDDREGVVAWHGLVLRRIRVQ